MKFDATSLTFIVIGVVCTTVIFALGLWIVPLLINRKRSYSKKKDIQKKVTEELAFNTRYKSPSTIAINQQQMLQKQDYGSVSIRNDVESGGTGLSKEVASPSCTIGSDATDIVPLISVTCEDEPIKSDSETNTNGSSKIIKKDSMDIDDLTDKACKRRFSSIVFSHSDELKVLSESSSLDTEKRERRASMSLFDTCKLVCPEISSQDMGHSTEHLNKLVLGTDSTLQGKLYFTINHKDESKKLLLELIKVSDIVVGKKQKYFYVDLALYHGAELIYSNKTECEACSGEVVNFDNNFDIDIIELKAVEENCERLILIFELFQGGQKKGGKFVSVGEVKFDLMGLIEGQILCVDGQEKFVICRNFTSSTVDKEKAIENTGKIHIFLRTLKKSPVDIVIGIVSAKDIESSKPFNSLNVRITLATEKKVIDSRKSKIIKRKLQNVDGEIKIDESFEFNVSLMKSVARDSSKLAKLNNDSVFLTIFLCGRNNIGFSHVLGKCVLGPIQFTDGTGLLHWTKSNSKLGDVIYQWHNLKI